MRKKPVNQVYDVLKAVYELEKKLKRTPNFAGVPHPEECSQHLREARRQLHEVLNEVSASDFRTDRAA